MARISGSKACSICKAVKSLEDFWTGRSYCKGCEKENDRERYRRNREAVIRRTKARNLANPDKVRDYRRAWKRKNPNKVAESNDRREERLAKAPGGPFNAARYKGRLELYYGMCAYCSENTATTWDHAIPLSKGGSNWPGNLYPACLRCNSSKGPKILHKEWTPPNKRRAKNK